jgi:hypothetical protein
VVDPFGRSVLVEAETEGVAGPVEQHAHVLLWLVPGVRRSQGSRCEHRFIEVGDSEVECAIGRCCSSSRG